MNNGQINALLKTHPTTSKNFLGVFASDTLPIKKNLQKPYSMVVNLDPINKSGSHWVTIYAPKGEFMEYFDSYGVQATGTIKSFLGRKYVYNIKFIQHPLSTVCGQYCIYYIYMRNIGTTMETLLKTFNAKTNIRNDLKVNRFVENNFQVNLHVFDQSYLHKQIATSFKKNIKTI
jgi:hypothetical protein